MMLRDLLVFAVVAMTVPLGCGQVDGNDAEPTCDLWGGTVTQADRQAYFFNNPDALEICLPMLACGLLEPGWDDNAVFPFTMCLVYNAEESAGRAERLACIQAFDGDCAALDACVMQSFDGETEERCEDGQGRRVSKQTGAVQGAYSCSRIYTGGGCDPLGKSCEPCGPSVTPDCGTPKASCESDDVYLDCRTEVTYAQSCGPGYHCVSEHNGCEGEGVNHCPEMEFACSGDNLTVCTESYSPFVYHCLDYGFSGCEQGKCVW